MQKTVKEKFENKYLKDKKYCKVRDHCHYTGEYRGTADSICNLKYSVPKKIPLVFHNEFNYDYHFIIKELAEEYEKKNYLFRRKHRKIYKEGTRIDKNGEEITKNISYVLQFFDSARFMASLLSNLVNNLSEEICKINLNMEMMIKNLKLVDSHTKYATVFLNTQTFKMI